MMEREKLRASADARSSTPNLPPAEGEQSNVAKYYPLSPEQWKKPFLELRNLHVIKHPRVFQTLFYLLGYSREDICERDTNALSFKKVKELINEDLFRAMGSYQPFGRRDTEFKDYQKLAFLKKNLSEVEEDKVDEFSIVMRQILKWVNLAIDIRIEDIVNRRDTVEYLKADRNQALHLQKERQASFERAL